MSEDAKVLFPGKTVVLSSGEEIEIQPFTFIECMTSAAKYARSFAGSIQNGSVLDIIADGGEDVLKLVQLAVKDDKGEPKPAKWWKRLAPDDGLALTTAVFEVNKSFFVERLQAPLEAMMRAIGGPSLPDSSAPAIPEETSTTTP